MEPMPVCAQEDTEDQGMGATHPRSQSRAGAGAILGASAPGLFSVACHSFQSLILNRMKN